MQIKYIFLFLLLPSLGFADILKCKDGSSYTGYVLPVYTDKSNNTHINGTCFRTDKGSTICGEDNGFSDIGCYIIQD